MKNRISRWVGLTFFFLTIAFFLFWFLRPNPLIGQARSMAVAARDGDGDVLYAATIQDERSCSQLTPAKVRSVWEILLEPYLKQSTFGGEDPIKLESNKSQAVAHFKFITAKGDPWSLMMIANKSDEGAKTNVIFSMLATASLFDDDGHANPTLTSRLAYDGAHRFRSKLESVGIHRLMLAPGSCVSWDEFEKQLQH